MLESSNAAIVEMPNYAAVIRAYECTSLLEKTIAALREQTKPPTSIIIVDSSNDAATTLKFHALGANVIPYGNKEFNFSNAINIGVASNTEPLTLIISSHVVLDDEKLVHDGWLAARVQEIEIAFWVRYSEENQIVLNRRRFTGRNGMANSLALVPTHLLRERPFLEEVFSAEDQEWTKYYLKRFGKPILRIESKRFSYLNPNHGSTNWSSTKLLNEELAIGHFVNRRLLMPDRILFRAARGMLAAIRNRPDRARMHLSHARALLMANFIRPKVQSRYF
jgi:glycosyltransferase involved in cell wall biosynthesis